MRSGLVGVFDPVFGKNGLDCTNGGPFQSDTEIAHVVTCVLRLAHPAIHDAMTADERDAAIYEDQLSVITVVEHANVADAISRVMNAERAASLNQSPAGFLAHVLATGCVHQKSHNHTGMAALNQYISQSPTKLAILPKKCLEVHGTGSTSNLQEQTVEKSSINQEYHRISLVHCAAGRASDRREKILDGGTAPEKQRSVTFSVRIGEP